MNYKYMIIVVIISAVHVFCGQSYHKEQLVKLEQNRSINNLKVVIRCANIPLITELKLKNEINNFFKKHQLSKGYKDDYTALVLVIAKQDKIQNTSHFYLSIDLYKHQGRSIIPIKDVWFLGKLNPKELNHEIKRLSSRLFTQK